MYLGSGFSRCCLKGTLQKTQQYKFLNLSSLLGSQMLLQDKMLKIFRELFEASLDYFELNHGSYPQPFLSVMRGCGAADPYMLNGI